MIHYAGNAAKDISMIKKDSLDVCNALSLLNAKVKMKRM